MYFVAGVNGVESRSEPGPGMQSLVEIEGLLPSQISRLHASFALWGDGGHAPGPVIPERVWIGENGDLAFHFEGDARPQPLGHVGLAADLAAWLVMLNSRMETFVVIARARTIWTPFELAQALMFATPSLLPPQLSANGSWQQVAHALAAAVAAGPLADGSQDKHWS